MKIVYETTMNKKPFWCMLGFHGRIFVKYEVVTEPVAGPFDDRSIEERTSGRYFFVCAKCGDKNEGVGGWNV